MGDCCSSACGPCPSTVILHATVSEVMVNELVRLQWVQQTTADYRIHEPYTLAAGSGRPTSISAQTCRCAQPLQRAHFSQMSTACLCPNPVPDVQRPPPCSSALRRTPSLHFPQTPLERPPSVPQVSNSRLRAQSQTGCSYSLCDMLVSLLYL